MSLLSSSTRKSFYPQRRSEQTVVTYVCPSPPVHAFILSVRGFSVSSARWFSSTFSDSRFRAAGDTLNNVRRGHHIGYILSAQTVMAYNKIILTCPSGKVSMGHALIISPARMAY